MRFTKRVARLWRRVERQASSPADSQTKAIPTRSNFTSTRRFAYEFHSIKPPPDNHRESDPDRLGHRAAHRGSRAQLTTGRGGNSSVRREPEIRSRGGDD